MKLAKCRNCGRKIDASAPYCPHCEVRHPARRPLRRALGFGVVAIAAAAAAYALARWPLPQGPSTASPQADSAAFAPAGNPSGTGDAVHSKVTPDAQPAPASRLAAPSQPVPAARSASPSQPARARRYVHTTVNVRAGPGTGHTVLTQLHSGDAVQVLSRSDNWAQVRIGPDRQGYIYVPLLKPAPPPG